MWEFIAIVCVIGAVFCLTWVAYRTGYDAGERKATGRK